MQRVDDVFVLTREENQDIAAGKNPNPIADMIVIVLCICPNPNDTWRLNPRMFRWSEQKNRELCDRGYITEATILKLRDFARGTGFVDIAIPFACRLDANRAFDALVNAGWVDVYLYDEGRLVNKYD
jgi:hypothetical protein